MAFVGAGCASTRWSPWRPLPLVKMLLGVAPGRRGSRRLALSMDWAGRGVLCLGVSERLVSSRLQRFVKDGNIVGQAIFENRDLKEDLSPLSSSLRDEMFSIVFWWAQVRLMRLIEKGMVWPYHAWYDYKGSNYTAAGGMPSSLPASCEFFMPI